MSETKAKKILIQINKPIDEKSVRDKPTELELDLLSDIKEMQKELRPSVWKVEK